MNFLPKIEYSPAFVEALEKQQAVAALGILLGCVTFVTVGAMKATVQNELASNDASEMMASDLNSMNDIG